MFYVNMYPEARWQKAQKVVDVNALLNERRIAKVAKTTGVITGTVVMSFLPPSIIAILGTYFEVLRKTWVFRSTETLMQLNSLASPVVYCYRDRRFRNTILDMLRLKKSEKPLPQEGATRRIVVSVKNPGSQDRRTASTPGLALALESVGSSNGIKLKRSMSAS